MTQTDERQWNDSTQEVYNLLQNSEGLYDEAEEIVSERQGIDALRDLVGEGSIPHVDLNKVQWEEIYYTWDREEAIARLKYVAPAETVIGDRSFSSTITYTVQYTDTTREEKVVSFWSVRVDTRLQSIQFRNITDDLAYLFRLPFDETFKENVVLAYRDEIYGYSIARYFAQRLGLVLYKDEHAFVSADIDE